MRQTMLLPPSKPEHPRCGTALSNSAIMRPVRPRIKHCLKAGLWRAYGSDLVLVGITSAIIANVLIDALD